MEKKKMQNVAFDTVDALLEFLPPDQLAIVERLRELVWTYAPEAEERMSFNVPFYRRYKLICYIWPGAVSWGNKTWEGVEFGFNYGYLLHDPNEYLDRGKRKQVYNKRFFSVDDINERVLSEFLQQAIEVDALMRNERGKKKST